MLVETLACRNYYILVHMECVIQKSSWKSVLDEIKRWGSQKLLAVFTVKD